MHKDEAHTDIRMTPTHKKALAVTLPARLPKVHRQAPAGKQQLQGTDQKLERKRAPAGTIAGTDTETKLEGTSKEAKLESKRKAPAGTVAGTDSESVPAKKQRNSEELERKPTGNQSLNPKEVYPSGHRPGPQPAHIPNRTGGHRQGSKA